MAFFFVWAACLLYWSILLRGIPYFSYFNNIFWFFAAFLTLAVVGVQYMLYKNIAIEKIFLLIAISVGLVYVFVLPPYTTSDEPFHIRTSYAYSNRMMFNERDVVRGEDASIGSGTFHRHPSIVDYHTFRELLFVRTTNTDLEARYMRKHVEPFYLYFFSAVGVTVARILRFGVVPLLVTGRIFNLIFFVVSTYFAIKLIPYGKMMLFSVAMFPMTIQLASSFSPDAVINGLAFLQIGCAFYLAYGKKNVYLHDIALFVCASALLAGAKGGAYLPLVFLCFLIPKEKLTANSVLQKLFHPFVLLCSFVSFMFFSLRRTFNVAVGDAGLAWETYDIAFIITNPTAFLAMLFRTVAEHRFFLIGSAVGSALGWQEIPVNRIVIMLFLVVTILAAIIMREDIVKMPALHKWAIVFIIAASIGLVLLGLLVGWTEVGSGHIVGVQGRYFIPLIPLGLLLLRSFFATIKKDLTWAVVSSICILHVTTIGIVVRYIAGRYI